MKIEGFEERWRKVLRTVQDKEEEIGRLKEKVAGSWDEGIKNENSGISREQASSWCELEITLQVR